nr:hypothetical protein BaRGS_007774 [Batillaria attramentaria]
MKEDQVIEMVVKEMDATGDGVVVKGELLYFFAHLMPGVQLENMDNLDALLALDDEILLQLAASIHITKHEFTQVWHNTYHDSMDFISATFDALEAFSGTVDGVMDEPDIEAIIEHALVNFDANGDGQLQNAELVAYLEHIYKNC